MTRAVQGLFNGGKSCVGKEEGMAHALQGEYELTLDQLMKLPGRSDLAGNAGFQSLRSAVMHKLR